MKKQALNPYLPSWKYIPDGEPHVFGDRVYIWFRSVWRICTVTAAAVTSGVIFFTNIITDGYTQFFFEKTRKSVKG
jgi:hypothetical protein